MSVLILGVDGGASSTRALVGTEQGDLRGFGRAGPSNHLQGEAARRRLRDALTGAVLAAVRGAGVDPSPIAACCLGMTGTWGDPDDHALIAGITRELVPCERIVVVGDIHAALMGASFGRPGVIVYAGTGSIAYAVDDAGSTYRAGGWGYLIDDLGGAYHTGRAALTTVFRASDGRAPPTALHERLLRHFGVATLAELRRLVYVDDGLDRPAIARLARVVADAARDGDRPAARILEEAGAQLAGLANAVLGRLPETGSSGTVYIVGGLFDAGPALLDAFAANLHAAHPHARVRRPEFPPVIGAWLLALRAAGGEPSEGLRRRLIAEVRRMGIA